MKLITLILMTSMQVISVSALAVDFGNPIGKFVTAYCDDRGCKLPPTQAIDDELNYLQQNFSQRNQQVHAFVELSAKAIHDSAVYYQDHANDKTLSQASRSAFADLAKAESDMQLSLQKLLPIYLKRIDPTQQSELAQAKIFLTNAWAAILGISDPTAKAGALDAYAKKFLHQFLDNSGQGAISRKTIQTVALKKVIEAQIPMAPWIDVSKYVKVVRNGCPADSPQFNCNFDYEINFAPTNKLPEYTEAGRLYYWLDFAAIEPQYYSDFTFALNYFKVPYNLTKRINFILAGEKTKQPLTVSFTYLGEDRSMSPDYTKVKPSYQQSQHQLKMYEYTYNGWGYYAVVSTPPDVLAILDSGRP